jgi:choline dehydrogenase-like flavoprotein
MLVNMNAQPVFDYIVVGSGFGGSVSAMRLREKDYSVLVLERGKRYRDQDFARSNWVAWKYLWLPSLRCFGILQITPFRNVLVLHGAGVGGGSLGYANVLMIPDEKLFAAPAWRHLADWKTILRPHYDTARRMLGVAANPCLWPADHALRDIANSLNRGRTFQPTEVKKCQTLISAAKARPEVDAPIAVDAWWDAATTPKTRLSRIIFTSPRNGARRYGRSAKCAMSGPCFPVNLMAHVTR